MSTMPAADTFSKLNFTGGFPSSVDLAPSIVFFILYALSLPVLVWRVVKYESRDRALIRPGIFLLVRLGTLGLRAVMSKNPYSIGELVAELILVSIGYLFLISTIATLWNRNVESHVPNRPSWVLRLSRLTQLVILASIITAIVGGSSTSNAFDDPSKLNTVVSLRHANVILALVSIVLVTIGNAVTQFEFSLPTRETSYLYLPCASLLVVAVYRVCQNFITGEGAPVQNKATFWVLEMFFEFVAYVSILSISLPEWYSQPDKNQNGSEKRSKRDHHDEQHTVEMGGRAQTRY